MDLTWVIVAAGAAVVLLVLLGLLARSRRVRRLAPARLGPTWQPPGDPGATAPIPDPAVVDHVVERTGLDHGVVHTAVAAWDEYRAVLGVAPLPAAYPFRIYDPYDPPVAERGPNGPVLDPVRVARDVERRTGISEGETAAALHALLADARGAGGGEEGERTSD